MSLEGEVMWRDDFPGTGHGHVAIALGDPCARDDRDT